MSSDIMTLLPVYMQMEDKAEVLAAIGPHLKESRYANGAQNSTTVPKWLIPCTVPDWMATGSESLWPDVWVTSYEESIVAHVTADFTCAPLAPSVSNQNNLESCRGQASP